VTRRRNVDAVSGDLFASIPQPAAAEPGGMDYRTRVAVLVHEILDDARAHDPGLDRYGVAAAVSRLVGKEVSKAMLDAYTAESRDAYNAPAWLMPALETVCHSHRYTTWLASNRGGRFLLGPAALDAEIGRVQGEMDALREQLRGLQDVRRRTRA
jgi:hypothetical protein